MVQTHHLERPRNHHRICNQHSFFPYLKCTSSVLVSSFMARLFKSFAALSATSCEGWQQAATRWLPMMDHNLDQIRRMRSASREHAYTPARKINICIRKKPFFLLEMAGDVIKRTYIRMTRQHDDMRHEVCLPVFWCAAVTSLVRQAVLGSVMSSSSLLTAARALMYTTTASPSRLLLKVYSCTREQSIIIH